MIKANKISHSFGNDLVLKDININININKGEFVAITGESGSGKSTLLSILSTLLKPSSGDIYFKKENYNNIKDINIFRQKNIGFIFQFHYLINYLTVKENIEIAKVSSSYSEILELLELLNIGNIINKFPTEISGGQRQRVAIARALINNPKVVFADEPTGNLDSKNSKNIYNIFKDLTKKGTTIIVATHDMNLASQCDINYEVKDGQL
jgi:putative ABC transport system ATP-binding protein